MNVVARHLSKYVVGILTTESATMAPRQRHLHLCVGCVYNSYKGLNFACSWSLAVYRRIGAVAIVSALAPFR